jgi:esterase/lipase superfamily enzyme
MHVEYHREFSHILERDMEYKVYGHAGKPVLAFPTMYGRFYEYENSGMIEAVRDFIDEGMIRIWTCDGIDGETFGNYRMHPYQRIRRHSLYDAYIARELVPSIRKASGQKLIATGCSMGAFHGANTFLRYPEHFDVLLALSGVYSTRCFFGNYMDSYVHHFSPINSLSHLEDEERLNAYRERDIIVCCGQGAYEDGVIEDTERLEEVLSMKDIPAWVDFWGEDVHHDWCWWQKQTAYFMEHLV